METSSPLIGSIGWIDLTVEHASQVRDFYQQVAHWSAADIDIDMGGYADYSMSPPGSRVAGCGHLSRAQR